MIIGIGLEYLLDDDGCFTLGDAARGAVFGLLGEGAFQGLKYAWRERLPLSRLLGEFIEDTSGTVPIDAATLGLTNVLKAAKRGGENFYTKVGRARHNALGLQVSKKEGWRFDYRLLGADGKYYRPDVISPRGRILEYKPNTPSGRAVGRRQLRIYFEQLGMRGRIIYYDPPW